MTLAFEPALVSFAIGASAILLAAIVQSTTGIGFGLIAAPLLVLLDPAYVPATVIFLGVLVSAMSSARDFRDINVRLTVAGIVGRLPAAFFAAGLVAAVPPETFELLFAGAIIGAVVLSLIGPKVAPSVPAMAAAGLVSGFMGTLTAAGAPPFAIALQNAPAHQMRATLNTVLLMGACLSLFSLAVFGEFGWADVIRGAALVPFVFLGFWLAKFTISNPAVQRAMRPAVLGICVAASCVLIIRAMSRHLT
ncbi:MAG: sulfite exporter TauE/SafE family protein [Pseudomonadota bacterium]